ncbi:hypothetical protein [Glycomyces sp. NPDC021274]|uniref:hypothetical protein n=1 Tax=Glycomyces sp. NPDC021274 TaxID=3155120 RepID=UPI0033D476F5
MPRILALAALPLLAAASLTAAGSADADSFLRTEPYELIVGSGGDPWCEEGGAAGDLAAPADLRGAHFSFSLDCLFSAPKVPADLAASIPALEHVPPAQDGSEFLFVQLALSSEYSPEHTTEPSLLASWIEVGEERISLAAAPRSSDHYVVSAPRDARAVLWVSDADRAQGIDLRTGAQVEPVAAYYNGLALRSYNLGGFEDDDPFRIVNERRSGTATCSTEYAEGTRALWLEDRGWAPEGTVFIEVRTRWCSRYNDITWELDRERAFTIDGEAPMSWTATERNAYWDDLVLVFTIPADVREATIDFSPVGDIRFKETGEELFTDDLPNFAWKLAF